MPQPRPPHPPPRRGLGRIEVIVAVVVGLILMSCVLSSLTPRHRRAAVIRDGVQQKQIHQAMLVWAGDHDDRLPLPSRMLADLGVERPEGDHTAALHSMMVARDFFTPELLISPAEQNPAIDEYASYDYEAYQPADGVLWDDGLRADLTARDPGRCHVSFHHMVLAGDRVEQQWRASANSSFPLLSTRGPSRGVMTGPVHDRSYTLLMLRSARRWAGNVIYADGSTRLEDSPFPGRVAWEPPGGQRQRDNIFDAEFGTSADAWSAGDAWLAHTGPVADRPARLADTRTALTESLRP